MTGEECFIFRLITYFSGVLVLVLRTIPQTEPVHSDPARYGISGYCYDKSQVKKKKYEHINERDVIIYLQDQKKGAIK